MNKLNELSDLILNNKGKPLEGAEPAGMLGGTLPLAEALETAAAPVDAPATPVLPQALKAHAERLSQAET